MHEVVDPLHGIPVSLLPFLWVSIIIFHGLIASIITQYVSFALPVVMAGSVIALLLQSTLIYRLQWTMLLSPGLEEPSGQSPQSINISVITLVNLVLEKR